MAALPVIYLQAKQRLPSARVYIQTEAVLFACWYLPELLLVGLLWYASTNDVWPDETADAFEHCAVLPHSGYRTDLPFAPEKAILCKAGKSRTALSCEFNQRS